MVIKQMLVHASVVHKCVQVADGALRCFASLADRFIRRGVDPAPLALNGLTQELLQRLSSAGCTAVAGAASSSPGKCKVLNLLLYTASLAV